MGIGFSIFLLAAGAILKFALHAKVAGVDIQVIGVILMAAGVLGLILTMFILAPRRRSTTIESRSVSSGGSVPGSTTSQTEVNKEVRGDQS